MKKISNPLTIVAIFAGLAEVFAITTLPKLDVSLQSLFIWFVMGFPILLVILFFLTWNFNPNVLYSPSDFKSDKSYIEHLKMVSEFKERLKEKALERNGMVSFDEVIEIMNKASEQSETFTKVYSCIFGANKGISLSEISTNCNINQTVALEIIHDCIEHGAVIEEITTEGNVIYTAKLGRD